jgi:hypothetical protein
MPEISRFFGIVIRMYFDDHNRAASMVFEWAALHQRELMQNWHRLHNAQPVERIKPLE